MQYYIGIDVGSSSMKLILMDETGIVVQQYNRDYNVDQPKPGWLEIRPEIWFEAMEDGLSVILQNIDAKLVKGIGVTGQLHTTIFLDGDGNSIRPAIMWNDTRTKEYIPYLKEKISKFPDLSSIFDILSTGSPAANLYWLKINEPENYAKLSTFLIGANYLVFRLTGCRGTDFSEASTSSLYDLHKKRWSPEMAQIVGLPNRVYPVIYGSAQTAGTLCLELAQKYGLNSQTMVIVGMGDNPASSISTGCLTKGYPVLSLGTSGVLMVPKKMRNLEGRGKNILFSFDNETFNVLVQGVVQTTGSDMTWWVRDILQSGDFEDGNDEGTLNRLGENNLIFYPHLMGDKTIYADPDLHGAFLGLSTDTTRVDMTHAVMEGICFAVKELAETMCFTQKQLNGLRVIGGCAQNCMWMQMMADVLNVEIKQLDGNISAAYGIALLAAYADNQYRNLGELVDRSISVNNSFYPRVRNAELYGKKYQKYQKIHDALKQIYASETASGMTKVLKRVKK